MKARLNWGEHKACDRLGMKPQNPAQPVLASLSSLCGLDMSMAQTLYSTDTGENISLKLKSAFCHLTVTRQNPKQWGLAQLPLLPLTPRCHRSHCLMDWERCQSSLLGPCSGNFHCGTQLLIKGNYPAISATQVWRCSSSPGHHAQQPFPGNKNQLCGKHE